MDEKNRSSKSLFGDDVRHSVETVEERWGREKTRRRSVMMHTVFPAVIVALALWLIPAAIFKFFPFNHYQTYDEYMAAMTASMKKDAALEILGNPDAKLKIKFIVPDMIGAPPGLRAALRNIADEHPSDIYIATWNQASVSEAERKLVGRDDEMVLVVNGKTELPYTTDDGKEAVFRCVRPAPEDMDQDMVPLIRALNREFRAATGINEDLTDPESFRPPKEEKPKNQLPTIVTEHQPEPEPGEEDKPNAETKVSPDDPAPIVLPSFRVDLNKR